MKNAAPLPILGLETDEEIEARRQRRVQKTAQTALAISTVGLSLMALLTPGFVSVLLFPTVARLNDSYHNILFVSSVAMIGPSLLSALIGYIVSTFASETPAGKRASSRALFTVLLFFVDTMSIGFLSPSARGTDSSETDTGMTSEIIARDKPTCACKRKV